MNPHLKNAEMVRQHIDHLLPGGNTIEFDKLNINVRYLVNTAKGINNIPLSMSSLIANYTLANFISQFQIKINLDGSKVPTNMVGFVLAGSGTSKDSTVNAQENAMNPGYMVIEEHRRESAQEAAQAKAEQTDGDTDQWRKYYKEPYPLTNSISTIEGLVSRLNSFASAGIGMGSVYSGELGSELASNPNMTDNIKLIAMLYDLGDYKSKAIKDAERQDQEVKGMGMNALFVGSEDNIIMDKKISQTFKMEFITKLARRSMFVYPTKQEFAECVIEFSSYEDMNTKQDHFEDLAREGKAYTGSMSMDLAQRLLERDSRLIDIDEDASQAFRDYKMYTNALGNGTTYVHKSVQLEQLHRSWKMLKLAGVYAILDDADSISMKHISEAIYYVEKIGSYMGYYEEYASKEPYELLVDYLQTHEDSRLTLHDLKKKGFINATSGLSHKVQELVKMADTVASTSGTVQVENDIVYYKPFEKVGEHHASYVSVKGSKEERATQCHSGYESKPTTFKKLSVLLENDTAYSPFRFSNGQRKNDNIISGATWVALDVDDSDITMNEMHSMLQDYNHHIGTTSNSDNPYKFRIMIEFNTVVDLEPREWKVFGKLLGRELGVTVDPATFTKSQIMFGYSGAKVLSENGAEPFDVTQVLKMTEQTKLQIGRPTQLSRTQMRKELDNPLETFGYAFSDEVPARSLALYKMWRHAFDLGSSQAEAEQLMIDLNWNFWSDPVSQKRFDSYIIQMKRAYDEKERD